MCIFAFQFGQPLPPTCDCTRDAQGTASRAVGLHDKTASKHQLDSLSETAKHALQSIDYGVYTAVYAQASNIFRARVGIVENATGVHLICARPLL